MAGGRKRFSQEILSLLVWAIRHPFMLCLNTVACWKTGQMAMFFNRFRPDASNWMSCRPEKVQSFTPVH